MPLKDSAVGVLAFRAAVLVVGLLAAGLSGCASEPTEAEYVERPVEQIYNDALGYVDDEKWYQAALQFDEVERQHPYSVWARRAILMATYCYYEANRYDQAIAGADRFIQLYPGNKDAPYAYYIKAVSLYEQITDVGRDQKKTRDALTALEDIVQRYPSSEYARDARLKIDLAHDHLAGKEMAIGRYYLRSGQYIAAINRFRTVVEKYQTTSHVPEALERLTEAYVALGVIKEAQASAAVLGYNYPGSEWYQDAYNLLKGAHAAPQKNDESWVTKAFSSVF